MLQIQSVNSIIQTLSNDIFTRSLLFVGLYFQCLISQGLFRNERIQYSEQFALNCNSNGSGCQYTNDERIFDFFVNFGSVPESCVHLKSDLTGQPFKCQKLVCDDGSKSGLTRFKHRAPGVRGPSRFSQ
ncbi:Cathepsin_B [Hexamita inflata]|uniref:Cathepsin_B n=1 Tax=Hexamita inflata TaxID=28002 RepID=A0ABP1H462_9EUKA